MRRALLRRLFDDAAVFPPGEAPLAFAVAAHEARARGPLHDLVGPLVVAQRHLAGLAGGPALDLAVTVSTPAAVPSVITVVAGLPARLAAVEAAVPADDDLVLPDVRGLDVYVELPRTERHTEVIRQLAGTALRAKVRLGPTPQLCPSVEELAETLMALARARVRFKATAGLHHAVPTRGQHGFLNLLAAAGAAWAGVGRDGLTRLLAETDARVLVERLERGPDPREMLLSIGTCSIAEPVADLVALGLLAPDSLAEAVR